MLVLLIFLCSTISHSSVFVAMRWEHRHGGSFKQQDRSAHLHHPMASSTTQLSGMKRPILDQLASTLFKLETDRVEASSVVDEQGRIGEPMEWSEQSSVANKFSQVVSSNPIGYRFKQWVADLIAGDYDEEMVDSKINNFINSGSNNNVVMFSFSTCPFCRRAKDYLEEQDIAFQSMELDELDDNQGNEIRAALGRRTKRTSVPSIFVNGQYIGGCNDGPGLLPLAESGELDRMLGRGGSVS